MATAPAPSASPQNAGMPNLQIVVTALQSQVQAIATLTSTFLTAFQNITDPSGTN